MPPPISAWQDELSAGLALRVGGGPQLASAHARDAGHARCLLLWRQAGRLSLSCCLGGVAREEGQDFTDGQFLAAGLRQREMRLDLVAVAASVFVLDHIPGCGQVGDDAVGAAVGDAQRLRRCRAAGCLGRGRWAARTRAWLVRKLQLFIAP